MFLINGERGCRLELFMRGCFDRNGSAQSGSKRSCKQEAYPYLRGTVTYRNFRMTNVPHASHSFRNALGRVCSIDVEFCYRSFSLSL